MYNRILKRPMFKRGGSSFKAQGTGITSPFDTPRKKYDAGAWGEWEQKTRDLTKDPRGDWSYAAQGFSSLADPYKESGEAKMISEMLFEGAQNVRGSREKARELEQKGELAILESQAAKLNAAKAHKYKLAEIAAAGKTDMLKKEPRNRQKARNRETLFKISQDPKNESSEFIGVYLNELADGYTDGDLASGAANVINPKLYTKDDSGNWGYDSGNLSADRVWFDPITSTWLVFQDTNGDGMADGAPIYSSIDVEDSITFFKQQPTGSVSSEGEAGNAAGTIKKEPKGDVDIKTGKLKKNKNTYDDQDYSQYTAEDFHPKASPDVIEESIKTADQEGEDITKFWDWVSKPKGIGQKKNEQIVKKATGGRIGYAEGDVAITELDMLNNWWKNMQANDWKE